MKSFETIKVNIEENIATLTLSRPKALNALNATLMEELYHFFTEELSGLNLKGIIITGDGEKSFVAGADISEFVEVKPGESFSPERGHRVFNAIESCPVPVIAAVNGFALGGGCELAMACHIRVASESALFGTPEVKLGIIPGYGGTQRLCQLVGRGRALELMMTADMIDGKEAYRIGLANHVVPSGQEVAKAQEILGKIGQKAPLAISKVIDSVGAYYAHNRDGFKSEIENFEYLTTTQDFREGAAAFLEKRKASFKGE